MNYIEATYLNDQKIVTSRARAWIARHAEDYIDDDTGLLDAEALAARALQEFGIAMEVARGLVEQVGERLLAAL